MLFHQRQRRPYRSLRAPANNNHDFHFFCKQCLKRLILGETTFKFYLLIAWCLGLIAMVLTQKKCVAFSILTMIYLLSQICGLLASISKCSKIFIPYVIMLIVTTFFNLFASCHFLMNILAKDYDKSKMNPELVQVLNSLSTGSKPLNFWISIGFLIYNFLCFFSVLYQCSLYERERVIEDRRRRDYLVRNAMIYERLVALNRLDNQGVTVNIDSPPKYSALDMKTVRETPPPGYSEAHKKTDTEKSTSSRNLFSK